jgi:hypothetical protein
MCTYVYGADSVLTANDHFLLEKFVGDLQYSVYRLDNIALELFMDLNAEKRKLKLN